MRTRVGYCGGSKKNPSYYSLGDHTEALSVDFDPGVLSYGDLLEIFWDSHNSDRNHSSRQYINAAFYRDPSQRELAEKSRDAIGSSVATEIIPVGEFTYAEGYHHKYYLTRYTQIREFLEATYPEAKSLADSTVAMRLNAFLGSGIRRDWNRFLAELADYGLPQA
ncbi:MAG: peptide-methionine (S)-S-oxide reductase, partial [Verrucomicrobiales bacterium]